MHFEALSACRKADDLTRVVPEHCTAAVQARHNDSLSCVLVVEVEEC